MRAPATRRPAVLLSAALIVAVGLAIYSNSFKGLFVLDEQTAIVDNPHIRSLATAFTAPKDVGIAGRPVASLSFAMNYALAPADAREAFTPPPPGYPPEAWDLLYRNLWGYHAVNLAIHIFAALALFGIVRRTLGGPRLGGRFGAAATPLALVVALLWLAHPLQTGAVTYVAQRVESMMGLFYLLTLYCAIRAFSAGGASSAPTGVLLARSVGAELARPKRAAALWSAAAIVACALGAATKEVIVSAPLVVILYDLIFVAAPGRAAPDTGHRTPDSGLSSRALFRARWPLYGGLAASWILIAVLVATSSHSASMGFGVKGWSSWMYLETQAGVIVHYLRLAVLASPVCLDYEWPAATSFTSILPQALLLASLFALTVWGLLRLKPLAFLGAWFFLILAPSSSFLPIPTEVAADHRMYLPLAAIIAAVVLGGYTLIGRVAQYAVGAELAPPTAKLAPPNAGRPRSAPTNRPPYVARAFRPANAIALIAAFLVIGTFGVMTCRRNADYTSDERIWSDTVAKRPSNSRARANYAAILVQQQRFTEAEAHLRAALALHPDYPEAHVNLGAALCSQGRLTEGIEHFRRAIALQPDYRDAHRNLGEALATMGRNAEAVAAFRQALETAPDDVVLMNKVGWLLATAPQDDVRDGQEALSLALRAVELSGGQDVDSLDTLAAGYAEVGRFSEASATIERALALAQSRGQSDLLPQLQYRLDLYRAGQRFREPLR